jgi:hypothetical protein
MKKLINQPDSFVRESLAGSFQLVKGEFRAYIRLPRRRTRDR